MVDPLTKQCFYMQLAPVTSQKSIAFKLLPILILISLACIAEVYFFSEMEIKKEISWTVVFLQSLVEIVPYLMIAFITNSIFDTIGRNVLKNVAIRILSLFVVLKIVWITMYALYDWQPLLAHSNLQEFDWFHFKDCNLVLIALGIGLTFGPTDTTASNPQ